MGQLATNIFIINEISLKLYLKNVNPKIVQIKHIINYLLR